MNTQVQYLSDKELTNLSGGFLFKLPATTKGSSSGAQSGSHNIQIIQNGVASNGGTVVQNVNVYTKPVTYNNIHNTTFVL